MANQPLQILLIEDDKVDRELVHRLLGQTDYCRLTDAHTATDARELIEQRRFDCALLDYHLPDAEGMDMLDQFVSRGIPVVMFTGSGSEDIAVEAMKRGAQDYLVKGKISGGSLRRAVNTAMEMVALKKELSRQQKELAQRTEEAEQRAAKLRYFATRLTSSENAERQRIAEIIHNELQQYMVAIAMRLDLLGQSIEQQELAELVRETRELQSSLIETARNLNKQLSPKILEHGNLAQAFRWLADWMKESHNLSVDTKFENASDDLSRELKTFLFEAARELLLNVVKHSNVDRATLRTDVRDRFLVVTVSDDGRGCKLESMATNESRDSGFGLFNIMERIDLFGGRVEIDTAPGRGCQIEIFAPLSERSPETAVEQSSPHRATSEPRSDQPDKIRILVVDDHQIVREGLVGALQQQCNCTIVGEAENGQQAIERAIEKKPDVIVMDINMPVLNGIEATARLRRELPEIAVVGLSVNDDSHTRDAMLNAGATDLLIKDIAIGELCGAITRAFESRANLR